MFSLLKFKKPKPTQIEKNRTAHKKLMKVWGGQKVMTGGRPIELIEQYYDNDCNIYYIHKNITDIHVSRHLKFTEAVKNIEWVVDAAVIKTRLKQIENANQQSDKDEVGRLTNDLLLRMDRLPPKRLFLQLALTMIYRHDENPYLYESNMMAAKLKSASQDPNLEAFFLSLAWEISKSCLNQDRLADYKIHSFHDFQHYFLEKTMREIEKRTG